MRVAASLILGTACAYGASLEVYSATVEGRDRCRIQASRVPGADAIVEWEDNVDTTGWAMQRVKASEATSARDSTTAAYAAGCVQGYASAKRMTQYWRNYAANEYSEGKPPQKLIDFMLAQQNFTVQLARGDVPPPVSPYTDDFMFGLRHVIAQFRGLLDGYRQRAEQDSIPEALDELEVFLLNSVGDLESLNSIESGENLKDCSGYVGRIAPEKAPAAGGALSDVGVFHSTWRSYYAMLRVAAVWDLPFAPAKVVSASSSPGFLHSKDDWYANGGDGRLVVFETTNAVFNQTLAREVSPDTLLTWQRAASAMMVSRSGEEWAGIFSVFNSGTYNSQWVITDGKLVAKAQSEGSSVLPANTLWVLEQIPTYVWKADMTSTLQAQGYWPSYNIPYNKKVFAMSGYPAQAAKDPEYGYNTTSRASIMARNASTTTTMKSLMALARYNDF